MIDYNAYALKKAQIKAIEAELKVMELEIINELDSISGHKLETDTATFSLMGKKKYRYSTELQEKEALTKEKIKFLKHEEEVTGKAELIEDGWQLRCQVKG